MTKENEIIVQIKTHTNLFKEWLHKNYTQEDIDEELYDDTGYPHWNDIEDTFEVAFKHLNFKALDEGTLENVSYLIARQWDVGNIFPYFRKEISLLGMTEEQLIVLAEYGVESSEWSFRQQCAASLFKIKQNKKVAQKIACQYLKDKDADIRRHALSSLNKLKYPKLEEVLEKSWAYNDELEMALCLQIWEEINIEKFHCYYNQIKNDKRELLKNYVVKFKKK